MPSFYHLQGDQEFGTVVDDFPGEILDFFCLVFGWGMDYLKTQYNTYRDVNDPWKIPLNDLYNLASQLNININPDIHPYTLRKAVLNNAVVNKQRGTVTGLEQELDILTGWSADLQISQNFMLENDQSAFIDPLYQSWSPSIAYALNEKVTFGNFFYNCIAINNEGNSPTGTSAANTWWQAITASDDNTVLKNTKTNYPNTWEVIYPSAVNGVPAANALVETIGVIDPLNSSANTKNRLKGINTSGGAANLWLRSVARTTSDMLTTTTTFAPNKDQVVGDGLPVPFVSPNLVWNGTTWKPNTRYGTDQIVTYSSQPFIALRASTNVIPPYASRGLTNNEWAPASFDSRLRLCISAYLTSSATSAATPFVEWYDANGNYITRVLARNPSAGSVTLPDQLYYDSFTSGAGSILSGRTSDDGQGVWNQRTGSFTVSPFNGGSVYQTTSGVRSYATLTTSGSGNCQVAVTFASTPAIGQTQGLLLRWQDDNNYLRADMTGVFLNQAGTFTTLGTYANPFNQGDRMIAQLNGSTITVLQNNVQVLQVTSAFNTTGLIHGIIVESSGGTGGGPAISVTNPGSITGTVGVSI